MLVAPLWISSSDPNLDVGLVVLNPLHGENIQQVLSVNELGIGSDNSNWHGSLASLQSPGHHQRTDYIPAPD